MGPNGSRFWLPLTRLGAFFVTVVVVGNFVFNAFRPTAADVITADESSDYFLRKKKRLQKQFQRTLERFLGAPAAGASTDRMSEVPAEPPVRVQLVKLVAPVLTPEPLQAIAPPSPPAPAPAATRLGFVEPEPVPFIWPEPV